MKKILLILTTFLSFNLLALENISLTLGQTKTIQLNEFVSLITLDKDGVVDIQKGESKKEILVKGKKNGPVELVLELESGKKLTYLISVGKTNKKAPKLSRIAKKLRVIKSLTVSISKGHVYITGKVKQASSLKYIANVKRMYPGLIIDGSERYMSRPQVIVDTVNKILSKYGIDNIRAKSYGKYIQLIGSPRDENQKNLALKLARTIDQGITDGLKTGLSAEPSVEIEVMFVEVSKTDKLKFGLKGSPIGGVNTSTSFMTGTMPVSLKDSGPISWQVTDISFFLELVKTSGRTRVISRPKLLSRSGEEARFHSGGTFFMESIQYVQGQKEIVVKPIDFGIELNILPIVDSLNQIGARITTSVKDIAEPKVEGGLPSLTVNEVNTHVTVRDGQSILISGLKKRRNSKEVSKVPLLGDIPLIGELFKSRKFEDEELDIVVLLTMKVVKDYGDSVAQYKKIWDNSHSDVEFSFYD